MNFSGVKIGFAMTGSFCTHSAALVTLERLAATGADILPILSETSAETTTRFMSSELLCSSIRDITGKMPLSSIRDAEPIGPRQLLDILVVLPCTGNTIAKLANSITDSSVLMACKSHLRNNRPIVLAISTNDALSGNAKNIGALMAIKNYYFVPFRQDDPFKKPFSVVADFDLLEDTLDAALRGRQLQPLLL